MDIIYIYSAFFLHTLIHAFTVCYTVSYPDYLAHAHKYMYSKYQASLLSVFGGLGSRLDIYVPGFVISLGFRKHRLKYVGSFLFEVNFTHTYLTRILG